MQRVLCVLLSLALMLSLSACGMNNSSSSTTSGGNAMNGGNESTGTGVGGAVGGAIGNAGDAINNAGNAIGNAVDGALDMTDLPFEEGASVMLDGKLYKLTGEVVRTDELGAQVLSTTDKITGIPANNGEAFGLEKETKVYQIKNNATNDAVAVEIEGAYYRATLHEDESNIGNGSGAANGTTSGNARSRSSTSASSGGMTNRR